MAAAERVHDGGAPHHTVRRVVVAAQRVVGEKRGQEGLAASSSI